MKWFHKKSFFSQLRASLREIFAIIDDTSVMNFRKNLQHNFPKMRGGRGSKAVWNFSENSSVMEEVGFPYRRNESDFKYFLGTSETFIRN